VRTKVAAVAPVVASVSLLAICVARIGPVPPYTDRYALSPDSSRVYLSMYDPASGVELAVLDLRSLSVVALEPMSAIGARSVAGPVRPVGSRGMAVSPDGTKLLIDGVTGDSSEWLSDSAQAVLVVDLATLTPVAVRGPFNSPAGG
jgi:hypothetical protein